MVSAIYEFLALKRIEADCKPLTSEDAHRIYDADLIQMRSSLYHDEFWYQTSKQMFKDFLR